MQQATTAERQALMDDTCQRVQAVAAVAGIGASQPADMARKHNAAMLIKSLPCSLLEQTRIADNLLLEASRTTG
jgi:hypothetical protein